ncbi:S-layer homology domain-containing protein, partial [Paenibacillus xanthanilyticus]
MKKLLMISLAAMVAFAAPLEPLAVKAANPALKVAEPSFKDLDQVPANLKTAILTAVQKGLLSGGADGRFHPEAGLTRQELAVIIQRALQLPAPKNVSAYADVKASGWSAPAIEAVRKSGIMLGDGKRKFNPAALVTREELAVLLLRASGVEPLASQAEPTPIADLANVKTWARASAQKAVELEILNMRGGNVFEPTGTVIRQEAALALLNTFYPSDRASTIGAVEGKRVRINGIPYAVGAGVSKLITAGNATVLKGARIEFEASGNTVNRIRSLTIVADGKPARTGYAEFSGNLVLEGGASVIDGDLTVSGDYISIRKLDVKGNLSISPEVQNDFYASGLRVSGQTEVLGGDSNTVVFESSQLGNMIVGKKEVRVVASGTTTIGDVNVNTNATITAADGVKLPQVTLAEGASAVKLQGTIDTVVVTNTQPTTLSGTANVSTLSVQSPSAVTLNVAGTVNKLQVTDPAAKVSVSPNVTVTTVALGAGVPTSAVASVSAASAPMAEPVNTAPYLVTPIADQIIQLTDTGLTYNLVPHFKDNEQSLLNYAVGSASPSILKVTANVDGVLTYAPVKGGKARISVAVDDFRGKRTNTSFFVTVNTAPADAAVSDQSLKIGVSDLLLPLNQWIMDVDNDVLAYEATIQDPKIAAIELKGTNHDQLAVKALKVGVTTITLKAVDGKGGTILRSFQLTVPNQAPVVANAPADLVLNLGQSDTSSDLATVFGEPDGQTMTYSVSSADPAVASAALSGTRLTIEALAGGMASVTLTAKDEAGLTVSADFVVTVNTKPIVSSMPVDRALPVGSEDASLDLSNVFADTLGDVLTYRAEAADASISAVTMNGSKLTLRALASGVTAITLYATDRNGLSEHAVFRLRTSRNPAVAVQPQDLLLLQGTNDARLDLASIFREPDGESMTYEADSSDTGTASVALNGSILSIQASRTGTATITLTATDVNGFKGTAAFQIKVNRKPVVDLPLTDKTIILGATDTSLDLAGVFSDPDGETLTYAAESSDTAVASVSLANARLSIDALAAGTAMITLTATDVNGLAQTAIFQVKVNRQPVSAGAPADRLVLVGDSESAIDLASVFSDPDGDALTYDAESSDSSTASATLNGSQLTVAGVATGTATITLTATDVNGFKGTAAFQVKVNRKPVADLVPADRTINLGATDTSLDLTSVFSDPDGETLTYAAESSDTVVASVSLANARLSIDALAAGTAEITLTATDVNGLAQTAIFQVKVNRQPVSAGAPADRLLLVGDSESAIDLASV